MRVIPATRPLPCTCQHSLCRECFDYELGELDAADLDRDEPITLEPDSDETLGLTRS